MSCYEWEHGVWKLSTKQFPAIVRDTQRAAAHHWQRVFNETQTFWANLTPAQKRTTAAYLEAVYAREDHPENQDNYMGKASDVHNLLRYSATRDISDGRTKPRRILKKDMPKNSAMSFECGAGSTLEFERKGRRIEWWVEDNNHAREYGRDHPIAQYFFARLEKVKWVRGTGGEVWGNDEYNDGDGVGGGGNYSLGTWGNPAAINS